MIFPVSASAEGAAAFRRDFVGKVRAQFRLDPPLKGEGDHPKGGGGVFPLGDEHTIARVTPLRRAFGAPPPLPGEDQQPVNIAAARS